MSTRTKKKSNTKPFYINKKSAKIKMKKRYNKGGVIGVIYKPPIINKRRTTIKPSTIKELTPSPLRKVKNTLAKSRIARTLKKKFIIYKKLADYNICSLCLDEMKYAKDVTLTPCNHIFHTSCLNNIPETLLQNRCPLCRAPLIKTSSKNASGLTLVQIDQLRAEMQNIDGTMHKELIKKLCTCQKFLWILKKKINWVINNWSIIDASYFESDAEMQEMTEWMNYLETWMNYLETLINKIIAIYSDVFPEYKHLFQVINNSNVIPFSMTIETIESDLRTIVDQLNNIYEDKETLKTHLDFYILAVEESYNEITDDIYLAPFMTTAKIMVNSNNPLTS
jgi:hypothetical protein